MRRLHKTHEEKVALKLTDIVNDYNLDIEQVGRYLARVAGLVAYNRLVEVIESAQYEKERQNDRTSNPEYTLFD
jgi:hypothetical protein